MCSNLLASIRNHRNDIVLQSHQIMDNFKRVPLCVFLIQATPHLSFSTVTVGMSTFGKYFVCKLEDHAVLPAKIFLKLNFEKPRKKRKIIFLKNSGLFE